MTLKRVEKIPKFTVLMTVTMGCPVPRSNYGVLTDIVIGGTL